MLRCVIGHDLNTLSDAVVVTQSSHLRYEGADDAILTYCPPKKNANEAVVKPFFSHYSAMRKLRGYSSIPTMIIKDNNETIKLVESFYIQCDSNAIIR